MHAKLEDSLITRLHFMTVFLQKKRKKKREKDEENGRFFESLYFRNSQRNLFQIWYVFSPNILAPAQRICSCLVKRPFSWAAQHTAVCLDHNLKKSYFLHLQHGQ